MQTSLIDIRTDPQAPGSSDRALSEFDVVVAGHICLDIIPRLGSHQHRPEDLFVPGGLVTIGPATLALGGCVANTGLALHRLGAKTRLVGKVGDDLLGKAILESLRVYDPSLPESMIVAAGEATSYTVVLSPPGVDRGFLHCPGANDTFVAEELHESVFQHARILHFGYPPLMRSIATDGGHGLSKRFAVAQAAGLLVSLDMAMPAAVLGSAPVDWSTWLANVLPHVDVFLPSYDELGVLLPGLAPTRKGDAKVEATQLEKFSNELLHFGVPIVVIKLGDQGLYLRTSDDVSKLAQRTAWKDFNWQAWRVRGCLAPCFDVEVVGTTGSGDCTIAGFLMALLQDAQPENALRLATGVGAHCVESADATSGIPACNDVEARLKSSWAQRPLATVWPGWHFHRERGVYMAPGDVTSIPQSAS